MNHFDMDFEHGGTDAKTGAPIRYIDSDMDCEEMEKPFNYTEWIDGMVSSGRMTIIEVEGTENVNEKLAEGWMLLAVTPISGFFVYTLGFIKEKSSIEYN